MVELFDTRVTIQQATPSRTSSGAVTSTWGTFAQRWAKIIVNSGREIEIARQKNPETDCIITIRGKLAVTPKMRVAHADGRYWDIIAVLPRSSSGPTSADIVDLHCKSGVGALAG